MGVLKSVGSRGLMVAIFGSLTPMAIGASLARWRHPDIAIAKAVSIGACFAPTSMGIALNVLRNGKVLDTPTGQLIIAAAILDDVIALMLLSVLQELSSPNPSALDIAQVLVTSPLLILVFGFIAVRVSPRIIKWVMDKIDIKYHEYAILLMLFLSMLILVPCCYYAKSSYLLGGFLCGLMFCTDHTIHHVWEKQMQKIMHWLLRIFFACTIGFEVPIQDFFRPEIMKGCAIYFTAVCGKMMTGVFATQKPMNKIEFFTISFSMSAWGEFAFILATSAYNHGIFGKDTLSEVLAAVLLSVIISPLLLRRTLIAYHSAKRKVLKTTRNVKSAAIPDSTQTSLDIQSVLTDTESGVTTPWATHFVYYRIHTTTAGAQWGHQDRLLRCLYSLHLKIIDFRAFNEAHDSYAWGQVENVFYVKDAELSLLPTKQLTIMSQRKLSKRVRVIKFEIRDALRDKRAKINIMRWLPGIKQTDDVYDLTSRKSIHAVEPSYVPDEAYKEARMSLSYAKLPTTHRIRGFVPDQKEEDDDVASTQSMRIQMTKDLRSTHQVFGRIRSKSHDFDVLDEKHDDLVKLIIDSVMDLHDVTDVGSDLTDLTAPSIHMNVINQNGHNQRKIKKIGVTHKTPLLKRKKPPQ
eukprot:542596_1